MKLVKKGDMRLAPVQFSGLAAIATSIAVVLTVQAQSPDLAFLTNGLVAYYPLNGNANDYSGNGDNGTVIGALLTTNRFGGTNGAYYFNSTNLSAISTKGINVPIGTSSRTFALWFAADNVNKDPNRGEMLFHFGDSTTTGDFYLKFETYGVCSMGDRTSVYVTQSGSPPLLDATWHHVVVTLESNRLTGYYDGKPITFVGFPAPTAVFNTGRGPFFIGYWNGEYFNGSIDDIRVYNRALSPQEVEALFNTESVLLPPTITRQPATQAIVRNSSASLDVAATGIGPIGFQWRFNGKAIPGATNSTYVISNFQPGNAGGYTVVVSNAAGSVTSKEGVLMLNPILNVIVTDGGTVSGISDQGNYAINSTATITAKPQPGYVFLGWSGDAIGTQNPITFAMDRDKTVLARFVVFSLNLKVSRTVSGNIIQLIILTEAGKKCQIDVSSDLKIWKAIGTVQTVSTSTQFIDPEIQPFSQRFYRVSFENQP